MRVSLHWLKRYVDIGVSSEELASQLTMAGLEVESIENLGEQYNNFVVGEVLEVRKHPNADKLTVCRVSNGGEILQIVCGAPNVAPHQKVPLGLIGATVPHNQHDPTGKPFVLSHVKVRGEDSYGMICSAYELNLGDDRDGIMILENHTSVGTALSSYLGLDDTVFEVGITPNRPDAMSHLGIAREVGALLGTKLKLPKFSLKEGRTGLKKHASVFLEAPQDCPRYTARVILGVKTGQSPEWLRQLLGAVGVRPVNNIVDITNFVLMECGQPLHAFDYDAISGHAITVRHAVAGEPFVTLDHKSRILQKDTLMICDARRPVAIAGIMGGEQTEISDSTHNILIESAYFHPASIRRTSKYFGLSTDASQRFERGADPNIARWANDRAASLVQEVCGGEILRGVIDEYPRKISPRRVTLRIKRTNEVLGTSLSGSMISACLKKLEVMPVAPSSGNRTTGSITFKAPTFRPDLEREIDLIEEVARVHGYNNIETRTESTLKYPIDAPQTDLSDILRHWLVGRGYREIITNSMQGKAISSIASKKSVDIINPISQDMATLRTSLVPGVLGAIRHNIFHGTKDLRLFEIGKVHFHDPLKNEENTLAPFLEEDHLILALCGSVHPLTWDLKPRKYDFFDLKGEVETLFHKIFLDKVKFIPYPTTDALTKAGLRIDIQGQDAGFLGLARKELLEMFEIEQEVFLVELNTDVIFRTIQLEHRYEDLPKFPAVTRDLAFTLEEAVSVEQVETEIREAGYPLLVKLEVFDVYAGDQLGVGKKSCAFALEFLSKEHTLTQEEVDQVVKNIINRASRKLNATLRT